MFTEHRFDILLDVRLAHVLNDGTLEVLLLNVGLAHHLIGSSSSRINLLHAILILPSLCTSLVLLSFPRAVSVAFKLGV